MTTKEKVQKKLAEKSTAPPRKKGADVTWSRAPLTGVLREDGVLKRLHFNPSTENCNVDDARKAGNVVELSWRDAIVRINESLAAGFRLPALFCDYCLPG